ncbi:MAG: NUDIX hydrolase [Prochlorococcaceae cyanobacterium]
MRALLKKAVARLGLYRLASAVYELYRVVARPHTHGALVAIWHRQRLLLVQASYRRSLSLPGGGIERGETPRQTAVRELAEELGLRVAPEELQSPWRITETSARGRNTVTILAWQADRRPEIRVDGLEIRACQWLTREEALTRPLVSHVREYLLATAQGSHTSASSIRNPGNSTPASTT